MSDRLTPEEFERCKHVQAGSEAGEEDAWAGMLFRAFCKVMPEIDVLRRDLAESERLRKEAELTIQVSSKPMKLIQEQIDALEAEKSKLTEERDNQYEYNADLIERYATLEQEKSVLVEALQPFADAEKAWMNNGDRIEIRMDWLTKASEVLVCGKRPEVTMAIKLADLQDRLAEEQRLRKEAESKMSIWLQGQDDEIKYLKEQIATLEAEKAALIEALQEVRGCLVLPTKTAIKEAYDAAGQALSSDSSQRALDRLKKLEELREAIAQVCMPNLLKGEIERLAAAEEAVFGK